MASHKQEGYTVTIQSYLVYPQEGQQSAAMEALRNLPGCEVIPASNRDVLVLVTEADDATAQVELEKKLETVPGIECLALVSGWTE